MDNCLIYCLHFPAWQNFSIAVNLKCDGIKLSWAKKAFLREVIQAQVSRKMRLSGWKKTNMSRFFGYALDKIIFKVETFSTGILSFLNESFVRGTKSAWSSWFFMAVIPLVFMYVPHIDHWLFVWNEPKNTSAVANRRYLWLELQI